jgi:diaminohydroxyphosphoribosylaminopyrimidine deaminase/5-amino-6-(5-phosphoribosylamino)uracil reductase
MSSDFDNRLLRHTLELAEQGTGRVEPNPRVGAVLVKAGEIIATGFHHHYGGLHAEAEALKSAGPAAAGATLYCNLEPCAFTSPEKHQPPCVDAIIRAGITRVVIGQLDPHPAMGGAGVMRLQEAGIAVTLCSNTELERNIWEFNEQFNTAMAMQRPMVHLKMAITLDGRIATTSGDSRWVSDSAAREDGHRLRRRVDGIVVGRRTVELDNPVLTARLPGVTRQPRPIVLSRNGQLPDQSRLLQERASELLVIVSEAAPSQQLQHLRDAGATVHLLPEVTPAAVLTTLWNEGIRAILVEGGGMITTAFLKSGFWDHLVAYIAPKIVGEGTSAVGALGIDTMQEAIAIDMPRWRQIGAQQCLEGWREGWYEDVYRTC